MVNTFLVHPDYTINSRLLDFRRLNKQITEATQIYKTCMRIKPYILNPTNIWDYYNQAKIIVATYKIPWGNHPAVIMWLGFENSLCDYIAACYHEWTTNRRRKNGTCCKYKNKPPVPTGPSIKPWWIYNTRIILSHRIALWNKELDRNEPKWYTKIKLFIDARNQVKDDLPYIWPSKIKLPRRKKQYQVLFKIYKSVL